uniref:Myeloid-derived growth factor n=1 Tax=Eptatretus burgeri TaxID=7764 RepID=A0A8C4Q6R5_EPTBU
MHTFTCTFTYAAQGGTNEKWHLSLGASDDSAVYSCSIWRPQGKSYLFFTQFKVETIGGTIEFADAFSKAIEGEKEVPLQQDEYIIRENSVSHNPGPFRAELSKLMVVARAHHEEL